MTSTIRPVGDDEWELVAWLWQAYRSDLAPIVRGLPYAGGRYAHGPLDDHPGPDRAGYLAWQPHPNTGADGLLAAGRHRAVRPRGRGMDRGAAAGARQARGAARPLDRDRSLGLPV
jgi:hypothetical protein